MTRSVQAKVVARLFAVPLEKPAHNCIDEATLKRLIVGYTTQAMYQVSTEVRPDSFSLLGYYRASMLERTLSVRLQVPEHDSPELQPAEHLWPLTDTALVNRHFTSIDDLEDAQAARAVELTRRRDLVRSATRFSWWPERIHRRHGPQVRPRFQEGGR